MNCNGLMYYMVPFIIFYLKLCSSDLFEDYTKLCNRQCDVGVSINCSLLDSKPVGRCCVNKTSAANDSSVVLGLDLKGCNLTSTEGLFTDMINLIEIYVEQNPLGKLDVGDFTGVTKLNYLSIPFGLDCPGGAEAWKSIQEKTNCTLCIDEIQTCTEYNGKLNVVTCDSKITCPNSQSHCVNNGPGMTECLCKHGYHGYKCLRKGVFPTEFFLIGMCVGTFVLSAVLWFTQRIHVKKKKKNI